jgi:hypothetical protein
MGNREEGGAGEKQGGSEERMIRVLCKLLENMFQSEKTTVRSSS